MGSEWSEATIGDVALVFDGPHATPRKTEYGPWFLSISSLQNGRVDLGASAHLSDVDYQRWIKRVRPMPGDTLFSYETRLGEAGHWDLNIPAALGRRMGLLRPRSGVVDPRFLTYAYLGPAFQNEIRKRANYGATVDRIPIADLPAWPITLPPLEEQRRIAGVLGALDDLIDANREQAGRVRQLSQSLYAVTIRNSGSLQLLGDVAAVNPDRVSLQMVGGISYVDIASLSDGSFGSTQMDWRDAPSRARRGAAPGDTLWSTVRPNRLGHALLTRQVDGLVVSTGIAVIRPTEIGPAELFAATDRQVFVDFLMSRAEGSAYPAVSASAIKEAPIPDLHPGDRHAFESTMWPLWQWAGELLEENEQLRSARDELLPLLMSGRVRVGEVAV